MVKHGERIAQMVINQYTKIEFEETSNPLEINDQKINSKEDIEENKKEEAIIEIRKHLDLKDNKNMTYQIPWDEAKTMLKSEIK